MKELDIYKLQRFLNRIEFICSIHIIAIDKHGQTPAKFDNVIDSIFKVLFGMNYHKGKQILLAIYDPTQLQPITGLPFCNME